MILTDSKHSDRPTSRLQQAVSSLFALAVISICLMAASPFSAAANPCPAAEDFKPQVLNCGFNTVATDHARTCSMQVHAEADAAIADAQQALRSCTPAKLNAAARRVIAALATMGQQTDLVGNYTHAMIDNPESVSAGTSLECFNREFDKIQIIVNAMDDDISRVKATYDIHDQGFAPTAPVARFDAGTDPGDLRYSDRDLAAAISLCIE